jgi:hypothetical protein
MAGCTKWSGIACCRCNGYRIYKEQYVLKGVKSSLPDCLRETQKRFLLRVNDFCVHDLVSTREQRQLQDTTIVTWYIFFNFATLLCAEHLFDICRVKIEHHLVSFFICQMSSCHDRKLFVGWQVKVPTGFQLCTCTESDWFSMSINQKKKH